MNEKREDQKKLENKDKKQIITNIENTKYTINLHYKKGNGESYKDKVIKLLKRDLES